MSSSSTSPLTDPLKLLVGLVAPLAVLAANARALAGFTIDDAYISFRYARNLADGLGLVYNAGERVEGYTNFLWTLLLALFYKCGLDPVIAAKLMGVAAVFGVMTLFFLMSGTTLCLANWLLVTSLSFQGHAMLGLEGGLFIFLLVLGVHLLEKRPGSAWPAAVFGLAALTRPEGPAYFVIAAALLSRRGRMKQFAVFFAVVAAHMAWRRWYYGAWTPNTLAAKTGDLPAQMASGYDYLRAYLTAGGPLLLLFVFGGAVAVVEGERRVRAFALLALFNAAYLAVIGADWMPGWRYLMPFEAFAFLVADFGARRVVESQGLAVQAGAVAVLVAGLWQRVELGGKTREAFDGQEVVWKRHARQTGRWLATHAAPGAVSLGDIGEVGWITNWPIYDVLGLVTPQVATLPGGYGQKSSTPQFVEEFFRASPRYFLLITDHGDCRHTPFPVMRAPFEDQRFASQYDFLHSVRLSATSAWCLYERQPAVATQRRAVLFPFEDAALPGWTKTGNAFDVGVARGAQGTQQAVIGGVGASIVNSFHPGAGDAATGTLTSPAFLIDRPKLALRVGGGASFETRVELLVDGERVAGAFGDDTEDLRRVVWDVRRFHGKTAQLRIVDDSAKGWGHILADQVESWDEGALGR